MEPNSDLTKQPDMMLRVQNKEPVMSSMCGDHPSVTKTVLNAKEKEDKEAAPAHTNRLTPTPSRTERPLERVDRAVERDRRGRSEHVLRTEPRRRPDAVPGNSGLVQAALGSFRWPPYLLAVWVLVLLLTHALHCVVGCLERALPHFRQVCQYFRAWTESSWRSEADSHRLYPAALAFITGTLYVLYFGLYALYHVAVWSIEPLCTEGESKASAEDVMEARVTDYVAEVNKSATSLKQ